MFNKKNVIGLMLVLAIMSTLTLSNFAYAVAYVNIANITGDTLQCVQQVLDNWNTKLNMNMIRISKVNNPKLVPAIDNYTCIKFVNFTTAKLDNSKAAIVGNGDIWMNTNIVNSQTKIKLVLSHEIGHVLGIGHVNGIRGFSTEDIMQSVFDTSNTVFGVYTVGLTFKYQQYAGSTVKYVLKGCNAVDGPGKIPR